MDEKRPNLPALTGLRFVAAFAVVCCHFQQWRPGLLSSSLFAWGDQAVGLFFVLSGFILARTYLVGGVLRGSIPAFAVARFARIYPVYALVMVIAIIPFLWDGGTGSLAHFPDALLSSLALLPAWNAYQFPSLDGPGWSLGAEAFFYALFPFLGQVIGRMPRRGYPWLLGVLYVWTLALPAWYLLHVHGQYDPFPLSLYFFPPARLPEFLMGVVLGCWLHAGARVSPAVGLTLQGAAVGVLSCALVFAACIPEPWTLTGIFAPIWLLLIASLATTANGISSILGNWRVMLLGEASYALYLLHAPLWVILVHILGIPVLGYAQGGLPIAGLYMLIGLTAAITLHRRVEVPARRAIRSWGAPKARRNTGLIDSRSGAVDIDLPAMRLDH